MKDTEKVGLQLGQLKDIETAGLIQLGQLKDIETAGLIKLGQLKDIETAGPTQSRQLKATGTAGIIQLGQLKDIETTGLIQLGQVSTERELAAPVRDSRAHILWDMSLEELMITGIEHVAFQVTIWSGEYFSLHIVKFLNKVY